VRPMPSGLLALSKESTTLIDTSLGCHNFMPENIQRRPGTASEETLHDIHQSIDGISKNNNGSLVVSTAYDRFRDEFRDFDTTDKWRLIQTGDGHTIGLGGVANGSRYLNINTGTTPNSETIILGRFSIKAPFKVSVGASLSQRIANQEFHIEMVEVDEDGNIVTDTELFTAPFFNNARNGVGLVFDGTSATNARMKLRAQGCSEEVATAASLGTNNSAATGTSPNFIQAFNYEIASTTEFAIVQANAVNSTSSGTSVKRTSAVPNPIRNYALCIRAKNLGVAPATATDFRIHTVRVLDASRVSVDFGIIGGRSDAQLAGLSLSVSGTMTMASASTSSGFATAFLRICDASTQNVVVKSAAGVIGAIQVSNTDTSAVYVKLYNQTTAPTSANTPALVFAVQPNTTLSIGAYAVPGLRFATGIGLRVTAGIANNDNTSITADKVIVSIQYT
jgi:hypothetical protein